VSETWKHLWSRYGFSLEQNSEGSMTDDNEDDNYIGDFPKITTADNDMVC